MASLPFINQKSRTVPENDILKVASRLRLQKANDSKKMDEILGSDVGREYQKFEDILKEQNKPNIRKNDIKQTEFPDKIEKNDNKIQQTIFKDEKNYSPERNENYSYNENKEKNFKNEEIKYMNEDINSQEQFNRFLINQINALESQFKNELKKTKSNLENEKELRSRLEINIKYLEEQQTLTLNEALSKISTLESKISKDDKIRNEMREKLMLSDQNQKELLNFFRNLQKQDSQELFSMKGFLHEKFNEDLTNLSKEREKSKALFLEVVRLGENQEKTTENLQSINMGLESRLKAIESRFQTGERTVNQLMVKGEQGINNVNEWNDKLDKRVQGLESNLLILGREQIKDKNTIDKIETMNQRMADDIKGLLMSLQSDYTLRLESKVTELVNRIIMEHEERIRLHEDFKDHLDLKEKINNEKQNYEKEEIRDKYKAMDSLVRAEFQRKDEAMRTLQTMFENHVVTLQNALKQEENARYLNEMTMREDYLRFQDVIRKESDLFKNQQMTMSEKIAEMIKIEIDTRLSSDVDLKNLTNAIASDLILEINQLKDSIEKQNKRFSQELKQISTESSEKASQLSIYIDDQIKKTNNFFSQKNEKIKSIFTKLAEQFKSHLLIYDVFKRDLSTKYINMDKEFQSEKVNIRTLLSDYENTTDLKLKNFKNLVEEEVIRKYAVLHDKCDKLQEQLNSDIDILKETMDISRELFVSRFKSILEEMYSKFDLHHSYHKETVENIIDIRNCMEKQELENESDRIVIARKINELEARIAIEIMAERSLRQAELKDIEEMLRNASEEIHKNVFNLKIMIENEERMRVFEKKLVDEGLDQLNAKMDETNKNIDLFFEDFKKHLAKLKDYFNEQETQSYLNEIMNREDSGYIREKINDLWSEFLNITQENKLILNENSNDLLNLKENYNNLKKDLEQQMNESYEKKLQVWFEKVKKENQELWEESVKNVQSNWKEIENIKPSNYDSLMRMNDIVPFIESYARPNYIQNLENKK